MPSLTLRSPPHPARAAPSRRGVATLAAVATLAIGLAGCGASGGSASGHASGSAGQASASNSGAAIFNSAGCSSCHTLAAAHASGSVGPNLDTLKPAYATVVHQVTNGGGLMPSFAHTLSGAQIAAVAHFVANATH